MIFLGSTFLSIGIQASGAEVLRTNIELHVDPLGNDAHDGKQKSPWATPARGLQECLRISQRNPDAHVQLWLHEGIYRITEPLTITIEHVPPQGSLTLAAFEQQSVTVSGGQVIDGWQVADDGTWSVEVPEVATGKWRFRELFVNGQRRPRARHPNSGYLRIVNSAEDRRSGFTFASGDLPETWTQGGELLFLHDWSTSRMPISHVDHDARRLTVEFPIGNRADHYKIDHFEAHPRYLVENHAAFLDAPGEWLLEDDGRLRYKPLPGESAQHTIAVAPVAHKLLQVNGTESTPIRNVHVQGIHWEHCRFELPVGGYAGSQATAHETRDPKTGLGMARVFVPPAVLFELAEDCSLTKSHVAHVGTSGVECGTRTHRMRIEDCVLEDISGNGLNLGEDTVRQVDGDAWWKAATNQAASGHVVTHNRIQMCGQQFYGAVALWVGIARQMQITHNEISQHPYTGISLGWMWNPTPTPAGYHFVAYNHIHHVMQILSDGGGIYTLGRQPGSKLIGNVIHDIPVNLGRAESNGMFLDEGSDQVEVADNTIYGLERSPLRFHRAEQMTIRNNVLVVPNSETPPIRYNNTQAATIKLIDNHVESSALFDPDRVDVPPTGPR